MITIYIPMSLYLLICDTYRDFDKRDRTNIICLMLTYYCAILHEDDLDVEFDIDEALDTFQVRYQVDHALFYAIAQTYYHRNKYTVRMLIDAVYPIIRNSGNIYALMDSHTTSNDCVFVVYD